MNRELEMHNTYLAAGINVSDVLTKVRSPNRLRFNIHEPQ